jgi:hypothetical protein
LGLVVEKAKSRRNRVVILVVTFKDLQKLVQSPSGPEQSKLLQRLRNKPFWYSDQKQHKQEDIKTKGDCCFNHIIALPRKDKVAFMLAQVVFLRVYRKA